MPEPKPNLPIRKNFEDSGSIKVSQENKPEKSKTKEGVDFVFEQNPEIAKIGTKEQYSLYLDTVFPDSKVKDIMWHGSSSKFENFDLENYSSSGNFGIGIHTTPDQSWAKRYAAGINGFLNGIILNIKNPFITSLRYKEYYGGNTFVPKIKMSEYIQNDGILNYEGLDRDSLKLINPYLIEYVGNKNNLGLPTYQEKVYSDPYLKEIVVFENEQAYILGNQNDIENFKKFIENNKDSQ